MNNLSQLHPQEWVRRFNEDEAVWRGFEDRRAQRRLFGLRSPFSEEVLERLDWEEAERECRITQCVGELIR